MFNIYTFKRLVRASFFLVSSLLLGCGGSGDGASAPPPIDTIPMNSEPTVSISGNDSVQERQTLFLNADATDSDGNITSYLWSVKSGPSVSLNGADSSELSFTAPDVDEDTSLVLDVTVTDNDGATTTSEISISITRKVSSVTINGLVTDKAITNANLVITVGDSIFNAVANENGIYNAIITIDESLVNELVQIRALGEQSINPEVEFVSLLTSVSNLILIAGDDGILNSSEDFRVNVTNVTTAEFALIEQAGPLPTSDSQLLEAQDAVNQEEKLILAALIKIVVDGEGDDAFNLPAGVISTLDLIDDKSTSEAFIAEVNAQNPSLIDETIDKIVNDTDLSDSAAIIGTWAMVDQAFTSLTFTDSGHYIHMEIGDPDDDCTSAEGGYELGTYNWVKETGVITITNTEDTNGCIGLHDGEPQNIPQILDSTITVVGNTLTLSNLEEGDYVFERTISDTNAVVGGYYEGDFDGDFFLSIVLENGNFMELTHDIEMLGMTLGTYSWDEDSNLFDHTSIIVNQTDDEFDQVIFKPIGDVVIWKDGDNAGVMKRTHTSRIQPYLTENNVIGNFTITEPGFDDVLISLIQEKLGQLIEPGEDIETFAWELQFGQLLLSFSDEQQEIEFITIISPSMITNTGFDASVAEFQMNSTSDGSEVGEFEYWTETWIRN